MTETERIARAYRERDAISPSRYDLRNAGNRMILDERRALARRLLDEAGFLPLGERRVLEIGCGNGAELASMLELGASPNRLVGVDLLPDRIASARATYPELEFHAGSAEHMDFADASFDLVMAMTIFTSILDASMSAKVAAEAYRVMKPGGALLWYDFRFDNPSNKNVRGIDEARLRELFPDLQGRLYRLTLVPPLARRLGPLAPAAYPVLAAAPPLRSHLLGLLRKAA